MGDIPTIDALATLGFEGRREAWARGQFLAALKILQHHDIDRAQMIGLVEGPVLQAAWPRELQALTRSQLLALQMALNARGFDTGTPDGMMGPVTQRNAAFVATSAAWACRQTAIRPWNFCSTCTDAPTPLLVQFTYRVLVLQNAL